MSLVMVYFEHAVKNLWEEYRCPMGLDEKHPLNASRSIPSPMISLFGTRFFQAVSDAPAFLILPERGKRLGYTLVTYSALFYISQRQVTNYIISFNA